MRNFKLPIDISEKGGMLLTDESKGALERESLRRFFRIKTR